MSVNAWRGMAAVVVVPMRPAWRGSDDTGGSDTPELLTMTAPPVVGS
jgi:hypothetical protein